MTTIGEFKERAAAAAAANTEPLLTGSELEDLKRGVRLDWINAEAQEKIAIETDWVIADELPPISKSDAEAVGLGKMPCPLCKGERLHKRRVRGEATGAVIYQKFRCPCRFPRRFFRTWNAMIPVAYRQFRLDTLAASRQSRMPMLMQERLIDGFRKNPDRSYLIVGPPGKSKTVFSTCLFGWGLRNWVLDTDELDAQANAPEACWYVSAFDLVNQAHEYIMQREKTYTDDFGHVQHCSAKEPLVTVQKIRRAAALGVRPRLFLEELDKLPSLTEFRASTIFELVKEVDAQGGQIVVTANKPADDLAKMYAIRDGEALIRRFTKNNATGDGMTIDLFKVETSPLIK